ncbi:hypothetical protein JQC91_01715 [Jannaschia sp. Os4]|uniref:hypothetical protein n=1 Tax=Jannaschia sp. Os4 TaxID=2807617 RepID=UPI00193A38DE|nr:hypothetical protein [Jannaschia sp. Os4]MBM2575009.1 hypothetical protein [Jannaschia sp. Os4]
MNRTEFVVTVAVVLLVAFTLGWVASWVVGRFRRVTADDMGEIDQMAQALHVAEEERDQAVAWAQAREREVSGKLVQTEAELAAAMEGLREARREASELRGYIESLNA